ncbi:MAG: hypothetical protein WAL99_11010 [Pseudonocardiaceae bacterium]|jgi:hypothetical protein
MLLETELRRLAVRVDLAQSAVTRLLERFDLVETDRSLYAAFPDLTSSDGQTHQSRLR